MRARLAAAAFALLAFPACAAAPHDVLGFYPGQSAKEGHALLKERAARACDRTAKCFEFNTAYLGQQGRIFVELDDKTGVSRIGFNISNDSQPKVPDCAKISGAVVAAAAKAYGRFDESDPGVSYTWRDAARKYKLTAICIPSMKHPPTGGIIGMLSAAK